MGQLYVMGIDAGAPKHPQWGLEGWHIRGDVERGRKRTRAREHVRAMSGGRWTIFIATEPRRGLCDP